MDLFTTTWSDVFRIVLSTAGIYAAVIVIVRVNGLRSLSKMSSFDFVMSVAVGSVVAGTLLGRSTSLVDGTIGLLSLFLFQHLVARARNAGAQPVLDNSPVVLMVGERMLDDVLERTRVTHDDVRGKLREANVIDLSEVHVVVLESTGDISVLHGSDGTPLDARLLEGVGGGEAALAALGRAA